MNMIRLRKSSIDRLRQGIRDGVNSRITTVTKRGQRVSTYPGPSDEHEISLAKYVKGLAFGSWQDASAERQLFEKALGETDGAAGGFLVPTELSTDLIGQLREESVLEQMPGVRKVPVRGSKDFGSLEDGATITYDGENEEIDEDTGVSFSKGTLTLSKATCLIKISRELLEDAEAAEEMLRADLTEALAEDIDVQLLRGTGGKKPLGLYFHPGVLNTDLSAGISADDFISAETQVRQNKGRVTGWVCDPAVVEDLRLLKDGHGRYIFNDNDAIGSAGVPQVGMRLRGVPVMDTTAVGTGAYPDAGETFVVGGHWRNLIIGEARRGMRIEATTEGGDSFKNDQLWIKLVYRYGYYLRHPETFVVIKGIS
jgi:HK97 family phage major capsid protein